MTESKIFDWPIGLSTGCFYQTSILDCLKPIQQAGFNLIEICSYHAHLDYHDKELVTRTASMIQDLGLEPYSFHAPFADKIDITAIDLARQKIALDELTQAAEAASLLGVANFVIHPGPEKELRLDKDRSKRFENAAKALKVVAKRCEELNLKLVFENMLPHLSFGQVSDLQWVLGKIDSSDVGVCLDTGHAYLSGEIETVVGKLTGHLTMLHANDNNGNYDDHLPPGEGRIAWPTLLKQISATDFHGTIILELAGDEDLERVLAKALSGRKHLREIAKQLANDNHTL